MYKCAPNGTVGPSPIPPPDDQPCQMSPFSDDRWVIDQEENIKRRQMHRNLVYNNFRRVQIPPEDVRHAPVELREPMQPPMNKVNPQKLEPVPEFKMDVAEKDPFKIEPPSYVKPKSLSEICFESPPPPNLFPKLKFSESGIVREELYRPTRPYMTPVYSRTPEKQSEATKKPQFHEFKDIKVDRAVHYGATVPFWRFK